MRSRVVDDSRIWHRIRAEMRALDGVQVEVGILQDAPAYEEHVSLVEVATIHEYGGDHVPERSYIRSTFDRERGKYEQRLERIADRALSGQPAGRLLDVFGEAVVSDIRGTIEARIAPPLAPATIRGRMRRLRRKRGGGRRPNNTTFKGFTPLIDTGRLRNSITHAVTRG